MYCVITRDPIDTAALLARVRGDADGAVVLFTGVVRNHCGGRRVTGLSYEAYDAMACRKLVEICDDATARYGLGAVAVSHRVGALAVGEVSVAVAVSAPHRHAAYRASQEIVERLKREVPIWKRERYEDGGEEWLEGNVPPPAHGP